MGILTRAVSKGQRDKVLKKTSATGPLHPESVGEAVAQQVADTPPTRGRLGNAPAKLWLATDTRGLWLASPGGAWPSRWARSTAGCWDVALSPQR